MAELWQSCGRVDKRGNRSLKYTVLTENINIYGSLRDCYYFFSI